MQLQWSINIVTNARNNSFSVAFKNCTPFRCIIKIDGTTIGDTKDLDLVMSMYNFIEYSSNFSDTTSSLWFYSKDETTDSDADIRNKILLNIWV